MLLAGIANNGKTIGEEVIGGIIWFWVWIFVAGYSDILNGALFSKNWFKFKFWFCIRFVPPNSGNVILLLISVFPSIFACPKSFSFADEPKSAVCASGSFWFKRFSILDELIKFICSDLEFSWRLSWIGIILFIILGLVEGYSETAVSVFLNWFWIKGFWFNCPFILYYEIN